MEIEGKGAQQCQLQGLIRDPQPLINLDNDEDDGNGARIDIRLKWTKPEEVRLVSYIIYLFCIFMYVLHG